MNPLNQVNIEETSTTYNIKLAYHSDRKCQNYDAEATGVENADGTITLYPRCIGASFEFYHSDPDRVIAIAQMMLSFAQMAKKNSRKVIDNVNIMR